MALREMINTNPWLAVLAAVVAIGGLFWAINHSQQDRRTMDQTYGVWYWDKEDEDYYLGTNEDEGIQAVMFACGDCSDEAARFVGYLEDRGSIRRPDDDRWYGGMGEQASRIRRELSQRCEAKGAALTRCRPSELP